MKNFLLVFGLMMTAIAAVIIIGVIAAHDSDFQSITNNVSHDSNARQAMMQIY
jgi:hypothetical protein